MKKQSMHREDGRVVYYFTFDDEPVAATSQSVAEQGGGAANE